MEGQILLFDSTLDEGERSPGCSLNLDEKLRMATQLDRLRPDFIEAGAPLDAPGEFEAVRLVAKTVESCGVVARCKPARTDIDRSWEAIQQAKKPRLHILIPLQVAQANEWPGMIKYARSHCADVQVSFDNAPGFGLETLTRLVAGAIEAGATTIGLPDSMGYATPDDYGAMFRALRENVAAVRTIVLGARCRNDLGLALANTLAALQNGARQAECTVNGIGERSGIAPLEELAMLIRAHAKKFCWHTGIQTGEIYKCSQLLSSFTGMPVPRNKPIVGANVFAQQPVQEQEHNGQSRYEAITPDSVGIKHSTIVLGKHSDKLVLRQRYKELGFDLSNEELDRLFHLFTQLLGQKKEIFDEDLIAIRENTTEEAQELYHLEKLQVHSGTTLMPTATVELRRGDQRFVDSATGDGPVDAALKAIERITGVTGQLLEYLIKSVSLGRDGFGEVFVRVDFQGMQFHGRGISTDVIAGSAKAYLEALNRALLARSRRPGERKDASTETAG